ncbi:alanine--tRNA ligase [Candidatus Gracilibacteria bacterium]|nr:alanine--tRNA ligase [Candidatus Gracilibacteria bacterium]MCF7819136.1 alanine--tRNA ligase [Candidatus Gracilibacteria bacterium]
MKYTTDYLREKWIAFWREKDHTILPSASVIPDNDPTALFHNSGMHPLVPFLMGEDHPEGKRLANAQKCIRTGDIDEVGDAVHLTFFEMLGNWSLGDYKKEDQIRWSYEFLTDEKWLGLDPEKLAVSVFAGDDDAPRDEEAAKVWQSCGIAPERIAYLGKADNWWAKGDIGPCGPDSEMFYWTGDKPAPENFQETHDDEHWVEIWNDVFMEFNRTEKGALESLPQKNIDTGMGLERTVAVLNGLQSVYQTYAFALILEKIADLAGKPELAKNPIAKTPEANSARIIADHLRSATVMIGDSIIPSNTDQGYILRRLIRRAIRHARKLGIQGSENESFGFCNSIAKTVIKKLSPYYPGLKTKESFILEELNREEAQFLKTLEKGEKEFEKLVSSLSRHPEFISGSPKSCSSSEIPKQVRNDKREGVIAGSDAFNLYETYGFPLEMTMELAEEKQLTVDEDGFYKAQELHQQKSRAGAEKKFSGGLGDKSEETVKLHTATHLLHAALRKVLGEHVEQRGSNITPERLRFDFSHEEKMTPEQITEVEKLVNDAIQADVPITKKEMTVEEAKQSGAIGLFEHKYGDKVKVYSMGDLSKEICGGPHVEHTGQLGSFKIKKEQASSRGVRRIKAVVGN